MLRLLDSPSVVIRAKAFLVLLEIIRNNREMLLTCCQNRCVSSLKNMTLFFSGIRAIVRTCMYYSVLALSTV